MKEVCKIFVFILFFVSNSNVFEKETPQNIFSTNQIEHYILNNFNSGNPINTNSVFESSSLDDCFDEYIVNDSNLYSYFKSELFFTHPVNIPQTININIWHPPQNS
jgi:hypothetical protein